MADNLQIARILMKYKKRSTSGNDHNSRSTTFTTAKIVNMFERVILHEL